MPGDVGLVAKLLDTVASWALDPNGLAQFRHRSEGDRLMKAMQQAHAAWKANPTEENRKARDDARDALSRWADAV